MGCCCSCLKDDANAASGNTSETELTTKQSQTNYRGGTGDQFTATDGPTLTVSRAMSAPSIDVKDRCKISGYGLALVGVTIEQDACYWEAHIEVDGADEVAKSNAYFDVLFGVSTKKSQKFYSAHAEVEDSSAGTEFMQPIKVKHGDIVGIAVQQSDLPMIQFLLNGEPLHNSNINRFRGAVYPAVFLPSENTEGPLSVKLVFNESHFQNEAPNVRFGPVIIARGII